MSAVKYQSVALQKYQRDSVARKYVESKSQKNTFTYVGVTLMKVHTFGLKY